MSFNSACNFAEIAIGVTAVGVVGVPLIRSILADLIA